MHKHVVIIHLGDGAISAQVSRPDVDIFLVDADFDDSTLEDLVMLDGLQCGVTRITPEQAKAGYPATVKDFADKTPGSPAAGPELGPLYQVLTAAISAHYNCLKSNNMEWAHRWREHFDKLVKEHMPSGSGFDNGTKLDLYRCNDERLAFETSFHHMDEQGSYTGWTEHTVTIKPSLQFGFDIHNVTGHNRGMVKDIITEAFHQALWKLVPRYPSHG